MTRALWTLPTIALLLTACGGIDDLSFDGDEAVSQDFERPSILGPHWEWPEITRFEDELDLYYDAQPRVVMQAEVASVSFENADQLVADEIAYTSRRDAFDWLVAEAEWFSQQDYLRFQELYADQDYEYTKTPASQEQFIAFNPDYGTSDLSILYYDASWSTDAGLVLITDFDPQQPDQPLFFADANRVVAVRPILVGTPGQRVDSGHAFAYTRALLDPDRELVTWSWNNEGSDEDELLTLEDVEAMPVDDAIAYIREAYGSRVSPHDWGWYDLGTYAENAGYLELARDIYATRRPWRMCGTGWPFREDISHRDVCGKLGDTSCYLRLDLSFIRGRGWYDDVIVRVDELGFDAERFILGLMVHEQGAVADEAPWDPGRIAQLIETYELKDAFIPRMEARATNPSLSEYERLRATQVLWALKRQYTHFAGDPTAAEQIAGLDLSPLSRAWVESIGRD